jgi:hypothetical protein
MIMGCLQEIWRCGRRESNEVLILIEHFDESPVVACCCMFRYEVTVHLKR